ncbi:MAG: YpmS family protein [Solibacillus sp.]
MNKWKIAFFTLATAVLITFAAVVYLIVAPVDQERVQAPLEAEGNVLVVETTAKEFEAIAKQYLGEAMNTSPLPVKLTVAEDVVIASELTVFSVDVPIRMHFDPIVESGNIVMKQTAVHVGKLNIPPKTVLKLMSDAIPFPDWITVQPNDEKIYVDLSRINIAAGSRVRAKEIDLANDKILLEIIVPTVGVK